MECKVGVPCTISWDGATGDWRVHFPGGDSHGRPVGAGCRLSLAQERAGASSFKTPRGFLMPWEQGSKSGFPERISTESLL